MLGKLLKYDFQLFWRKLMPMYGGMLGLSLLLGLSIRFMDITGDNVGSVSLTSLLSVTFFILIFVNIVMSIVILVQSYYKNLLGNQGYLMFSLPVNTRTLVTSKLISATLLILIGSVVGILSFVIISVCQIGGIIETLTLGMISQAIQEIMAELFAVVNIGVVILVILDILFELASGVAQVYAAISVGHVIKSNSVGMAWAIFIVSGVLVSIINSAFGNLPVDMSETMRITLSLLGHVIYTGVFWAISWIVLEKKLNLV